MQARGSVLPRQPRWLAGIFAVAVLLALAPRAHAQSEGPNDPAVAADDACVAGASWFPAGNAVSSNDMYAQVSPAGMPTHCLKATDYSFNIPSPAQIKGIEVSIERHSSGGSVKDSSLKIVKGGTITGTDHADTVTIWPLTDTVATYGGSSDLWGTAWTPADINGTGFGAALSVIDSGQTASVDVIRVKVYYDLCSTAPAVGCRTSTKSIFVVKDKTDDTKDKMIWKWIKGQSTQQADFGSPTTPVTGASNALCIYANGALIGETLVGPSGTLWVPISTKGYKYKDTAGTQSGVTKIVQKGSAPAVDKAKILEKGKGLGLPDIHPTFTLPVVVQMVNSETGICWTSTFNSMIKNETGFFKAKNP